MNIMINVFSRISLFILLLIIHAEYNLSNELELKNSRSIASLPSNSCSYYAWNFITNQKLFKIYNRSIEDLLSEGQQRYLKNGQFSFELGENKSREFSGLVNQGIWFVETEEHGKLVIKGLNPRNTTRSFLPSDDLALAEIHNAKAMHALGIGPKADIVEVEGMLYLVTGYVEGINIKEILHAICYSPTTKARIEKILNITTSTTHEAVRQYAKAIVADAKLIERMREIAQLLNRMRFINNDLQFIVLPSLGANKFQIGIIDTISFSQLQRRPAKSISLVPAMEQLIKRLQRLAQHTKKL